MRRNLYSLLVFFTVILLFQSFYLTNKSAHAGAPRLGSCTDQQERLVPIDYHDGLETYAKVVVTGSGNDVRYRIQVNPTHYYLSRETQQWLFYRQCGRINLNHRSVQNQSARISVHEDREADCWAIKHILHERRLITIRQVERIERDIVMLERESNRWRAIFGARRSRVSIMECLEQ